MTFISKIGFILYIALASCISMADVGTLSNFSSVKSFQEWKAEKIQAVVVQANGVRMQINKAQAEGNLRLKESLERQLHQLKWNGEVARDLAVADYFSLYLSQQTQVDRYQQAALKMSVQEIAELMEAYSAVLGLKKPENQLTQANAHEARKPNPATIQAAQQK